MCAILLIYILQKLVEPILYRYIHRSIDGRMDGWIHRRIQIKKHGIKDGIFLEDLVSHTIPAPTLKASDFFTPQKFASPAMLF